MKILLTGGTGYVGRALRKELRDRGHDVRLIVRRQSKGKIGNHEGFEIVYGDVLDTQSCLRAADACDAVVNLIGIIREYPQEGITYEAFHTTVTYNVLDAARRMGVERFVQMSALGTRPDARSRYHRTKYEAEQIVTRSNLRWTIFRPSVIFSRGDQFTRELVDLVHRPIVPVVDGGKALLQPVSLQNVCGPMAMSLHMPETQGKIYELGGPDRVAFGDLLRKIASHYKVWMNTMKIPAGLMRPVVKTFQRFKPFPLTVDQLSMLIEDNVCDTAEFTRVFGIAELDSFLDALPSLLEAVHRKAA